MSVTAEPSDPLPASSIPPGERVYAIGDIHGRLDLLIDLFAMIAVDSQTRGHRPATVIILGDFIDRGPDSAALIAQLQRYQKEFGKWVVLKGNHEATMVAALSGDVEAMSAWLTYGGDATLRSFGLTDDLLQSGASALIIHEARKVVDPQIVKWLSRLPLTHQVGDYLFVHAGVRPGVPLKSQTELDLLWIGEEFLKSDEAHPAVIVHGHHIEEDGPTVAPHRIGLDTGAYRTGRLSALGLEDSSRWLLTTQEVATTRAVA